MVIHPTATPTVEPSATPTQIPSPIPTRRPKPKATPLPTTPWGVAQQISEHDWTIKIADDPSMASPNEVLLALNHYRNVHGVSSLQSDAILTAYAQTRADHLFSIQNTDSHQGFIDFVNNQDGFNKLGFNGLGENISFGYQLQGVHLIEWLFASDKPHNDNQINPKWTHVGIAVHASALSLVFGYDKR